MSIISKLLSKVGLGGVSAVATVDTRSVNVAALLSVGLKMGSWVMTPEGIGIVSYCGPVQDLLKEAVYNSYIGEDGTPVTELVSAAEYGPIYTGVGVNLVELDGTNKVVLDSRKRAVNAVYKGKLESVRKAYFDEFPQRNFEMEGSYVEAARNNPAAMRAVVAFRKRYPNVNSYEDYIRMHGYIHSSEVTK